MTISEAEIACDDFYQDLVDAANVNPNSEVAYSFMWKAEGHWHSVCEYLDDAKKLAEATPNNCVYSSEVEDLLVVVEGGLRLANKLLEKSREY